MARQAIRREGQDGEEAFLNAVPHSRTTDSAKRGDVRVLCDGVDAYIEVKSCHAATGKAGTLNQVRAIKYIPLVVFAPARDTWYVLPAHALVRLAADKQRGQHTEIPFESMNLALNASLDSFGCTTGELPDRVHEAVRADRAFVLLRRQMERLLKDISDLRDSHRAAVRALLSSRVS